MMLFNIGLLDWLQLDEKDELGADAPSRLAHNIAAKLANNFLTNVEPKTNAVRVDFTGALNEAVKLE